MLAHQSATAAPLVCGIDFSVDSRRALVFAANLAGRLQRPLTVVTVIDPLLAEAADLTTGAGRFAADAVRELEALAADCVATAEGEAPRLTVSTETGSPAAALLDLAAREDAFLVAVGAQGLGRGKRLLLGSTTLRLLRRADRPILSVPPTAFDADSVDHVLWGTDLGPVAAQAGLVADQLAVKLSVPLTVVHAVEPVVVPAQWDAVVAKVLDSRRAEAETRVAAVIRSLKSPATAHVRVGKAVEVLGEAGREGRPLIALGLESHDGHRPGTLAYQMLSESKAPVLAVPATPNG